MFGDIAGEKMSGEAGNIIESECVIFVLSYVTPLSIIKCTSNLIMMIFVESVEFKQSLIKNR